MAGRAPPADRPSGRRPSPAGHRCARRCRPSWPRPPATSPWRARGRRRAPRRWRASRARSRARAPAARSAGGGRPRARAPPRSATARPSTAGTPRARTPPRRAAHRCRAGRAGAGPGPRVRRRARRGPPCPDTLAGGERTALTHLTDVGGTVPRRTSAAPRQETVHRKLTVTVRFRPTLTSGRGKETAVADFLEEKRKEIQQRLDELKPLVDEFHRLEAAAAAPPRAAAAGAGAAPPPPPPAP